jgi:hypothetical protein
MRRFRFSRLRLSDVADVAFRALFRVSWKKEVVMRCAARPSALHAFNGTHRKRVGTGRDDLHMMHSVMHIVHRNRFPSHLRALFFAS